MVRGPTQIDDHILLNVSFFLDQLLILPFGNNINYIEDNRESCGGSRQDKKKKMLKGESEAWELVAQAATIWWLRVVLVHGFYEGMREGEVARECDGR